MLIDEKTKQILKENEIGVYKITNIKNNKIYIGSSARLNNRKNEHISDLNLNKHHSKHLQRAWNKYGEDNFRYEVIEVLEDDVLLLEREQYWLDFYKSYDKNIGYNIYKIAGSPLGYKHSDETKQLLSKLGKGLKRTEETRKKISEANKGKVLSQETISKLREVNKNRIHKKGYKYSLESRIKMSEPIIQLDLDGNFIKEWDGANFAAKELLFDCSCIVKCCKGKQKTHKNYIWVYKKDYDIKNVS